MKEFSVVLPVKNEVEMLRLSLPSSFALEPAEVVIALDDGHEDLEHEAQKLAEKHRYNGLLNIIHVPRNPNWLFHQAWVRRTAFLMARYDKIFTFDVDGILTPNVLKGYGIVGIDNVAFVTFDKFLYRAKFIHALRTFLWMIRRKIAFLRRKLTVNPTNIFIGIYWLWRPYYLDLVKEEEISNILNGEDTFIQVKLAKQHKYKHIHVYEPGAKMLRGENESNFNRQYELGLWLGAREKYLTQHISLPLRPIKKLLSFVFVLLQMVTKGYPHIMKGYAAGRKLHPTQAGLLAKHSYAEVSMFTKVMKDEIVFSRWSV